MARKYKQIKFRGKNIRYLNTGTLARKLRITDTQARKLESGAQTIYAIANGEIDRFSSEDIPKFLKSFGVKKISNKKLLTSGEDKIKDIVISTDGIDGETKVKGQVNFEYEAKVSKDIVKRSGSFLIEDFKVKDIEEAIINFINNFFIKVQVFDPRETEITKVAFTSFKTTREFSLKDSKLFKLDIKLRKIFNNLIDNEVVEENCLIDYIKARHILPKKLRYLQDDFDKDNMTPKILKEYCDILNCKMILYDFEGRVIVSSYPTKKSKYKNIIGVAYNNHFYPLKKNILQKKKVMPKSIVIVENCFQNILKLIREKKELPIDVVVNNLGFDDNIDVLSYVYDKVKYIQNPEYLECKEILEKFGLADKIYDGIKKFQLGSIIYKLYKTDDDKSFFPNHERFVKSGYSYFNEDVKFNYDDVKTLDKNKCYPSCLKNLPYLIKMDYSQNRIITDKNELNELIDNYIYLVKVKKSSILLPDNNIYTGKHLKYCRNSGFNFEILQGMTTKTVPNFYVKMIGDLSKRLPPLDFKIIMNAFIGKMEQANTLKNSMKFRKFCNYDESLKTGGNVMEVSIEDDLFMVFDIEKRFNNYTQKPIAIQIKDSSRRLLFKKILELGLKEKDIIQINTDSISFIDRYNMLEVIGTGGDYFTLDNWKIEGFKKISKPHPYIERILSLYTTINNKNIITDAIAGAGKTYKIVKEIIPKLNYIDYLVLTPTHQSLRSYKREKLNSEIIQKYNYSNEIPEEDNIIIDEHGMLDIKSRDFIYKCAIIGKHIQSFGDYTQLPPVGEEYCNSPQYLDLLFSYKDVMYENHRNNFTKEYYDEIKNNLEFGKQEVRRHSTKSWEDADVILCFRNEIRDLYNQKKLKSLGFSSMIEEGVKVVCFTNKLREKNIYNRYDAIIKEIQGNMILFDNGNEISKGELQKNFRPNYATNAYGIQGSSKSSYYYCEEDENFLTPNVSYVIISRLKGFDYTFDIPK